MKRRATFEAATRYNAPVIAALLAAIVLGAGCIAALGWLVFGAVR